MKFLNEIYFKNEIELNEKTLTGAAPGSYTEKRRWGGTNEKKGIEPPPVQTVTGKDYE